MQRQTYTIDGANFSTLEEFYEEVSAAIVPGEYWGRNLDAFNNILRGVGPPDEGFDLRWQNSALSQERLGYPETVRQLEHRLMTCQPDHVPVVTLELERARSRHGPTVFNWLMDIIQSSGRVQLTLE